MKKVLITSDRFEGCVELVYGEAGMGENTFPPVVVVDFRGAVLSDVQANSLLRYMPVRLGPGFEQSWGNAPLKIVVVDGVYEFEGDFWTAYGKKVNKDRCLKEWAKMSVGDRVLAVGRLPAYLRYLGRTGVAKADPENYLRKRYYRNDYDNL